MKCACWTGQLFSRCRAQGILPCSCRQAQRQASRCSVRCRVPARLRMAALSWHGHARRQLSAARLRMEPSSTTFGNWTCCLPTRPPLATGRPSAAATPSAVVPRRRAADASLRSRCSSSHACTLWAGLDQPRGFPASCSTPAPPILAALACFSVVRKFSCSISAACIQETTSRSRTPRTRQLRNALSSALALLSCGVRAWRQARWRTHARTVLQIRLRVGSCTRTRAWRRRRGVLSAACVASDASKHNNTRHSRVHNPPPSHSQQRAHDTADCLAHARGGVQPRRLQRRCAGSACRDGGPVWPRACGWRRRRRCRCGGRALLGLCAQRGRV
jgi:hypothetical protein